MHNTTQTDNTEKCACGEVFCVQRHCFIALDETALLLRAVHAVRRVLWAFVASPLLVCHQACVEASKENAVPCAESAANLSSVAAHAPHASQHEMINCLKFYFLCLGQLCPRHGLLRISLWRGESDLAQLHLLGAPLLGTPCTRLLLPPGQL